MNISLSIKQSLTPLFLVLIAASYINIFFLLTSVASLFVLFPKKIKIFISITLLSVFFANLNLMKMPASDALVYIEALEILQDYNLLELIYFNYVSFRDIEFIFNIYMWSIAQLDVSGALFFFLSTFIIYMLYGLSLLMIIDKKKINDLFFILILSLMLLSLTFSLSGHLVRQYLAFSVFFYGVNMLKVNFNRGRVILFISMFIHLSVAPFILLMPFFIYCYRKFGGYKVVVSTLIFSFFISTFIIRLMPYAEAVFNNNDGEVPFSLLMLDGGLLVTFFTMIYIRQKFNSELFTVFIAVLTLLLACLIATYPIKLLFLRYYFVMDFFRGAIIIYLFMLFKFDRVSEVLSVLVFLSLSFFVFSFRLETSPWDYGGDIIESIFSSTFAFFDRIEHVWL
jgi:hypothetical protein